MIGRIYAVAANTFRESVRERVLYNLVFFAILMMASGALLKDLSIRQDEKILKDIGLAAMDLFGTMMAIFLGVSLVSKEIERRSLFPLLAKPLARSEFLLGKYAGLCFTLLLNVAVMAMALNLTLYLTGRSGGLHLLKAVYGIYLGLMLVVAIAVLLSTLLSNVLATVGTLALVIAGRLSDILQKMHQVAPEVPRWLVTTLYAAIPNFRNFDLKDNVVYGDPVSAGHLGWLTLYAAAYISVAIGVALLAFRRRDLQ